MNGWTIETPAPAGAASLANFGAAQFSLTFGHNYPAKDLSDFLAQSYSAEKWARLLADPSQHWRCAKASDGTIVGYVQAAPMGLPLAHEAGAKELCKLYVADAVKGTGLAGTLHQSVVDWARSAGAPALYLGVWSLNPRAKAFYRKVGFEAVGRYQFQVGSTLDDDIIMRLKV
jgi:diamine N-acetyltransferase